jgi:ABC-type sugar transport system ATPase subunit
MEMNEGTTFLKIENLSKQKNGNIAVDDISIILYKKLRTSIIGETGSGKSTFLKLLAGLEQPDNGSIHFNDIRVLGANEKLIAGHSKIAYLSQHFELRNNYKVSEVLSYVNKLNEQESNKIYQLCRIDHLFKRWTDELSGGEKQRIALAALLTTSPSLLLLDEPYSNLDQIHKNEIRSLIHEISKLINITCILVSHDVQDVLSWSDYLIIFKSGKIIQEGSPESIYHQPVNEYCAALLGDYQLIDASSNFLKKIFPNSPDSQKKLFIRPGYFKINDTQNNTGAGIVTEISFFGNYTLATIQTGDVYLKMTVMPNEIKVGEPVAFSFNRDEHWFI